MAPFLFFFYSFFEGAWRPQRKKEKDGKGWLEYETLLCEWQRKRFSSLARFLMLARIQSHFLWPPVGVTDSLSITWSRDHSVKDRDWIAYRLTHNLRYLTTLSFIRLEGWESGRTRNLSSELSSVVSRPGSGRSSRQIISCSCAHSPLHHRLWIGLEANSKRFLILVVSRPQPGPFLSHGPSLYFLLTGLQATRKKWEVRKERCLGSRPENSFYTVKKREEDWVIENEVDRISF